MRIPDETRSRKRNRYKLNEEIDFNEVEIQSNDEEDKVDQKSMQDTKLMKSEEITESRHEKILETCENFEKKLKEVENQFKISEEQKLNIENEKAKIIAEMQSQINSLSATVSNLNEKLKATVEDNENKNTKIAEQQNVIDALTSNNDLKKKEIKDLNHVLTEERLRIEKLTSPISAQVNNIVSVII